MDVRHKKKEWKAGLMKWTKSDLAERLMLAYGTIQNLEEKQERQAVMLADIRRHVQECPDGVGRFIHERMQDFDQPPNA